MELKPVKRFLKVNLPKLLIVPYGIETLTMLCRNMTVQAFNRTLWN